MPIYGYRCGECGHELEVFQSMSDAPLRECSRCGGALRKLLYPVGVRFKGSGFYSTDYGGRGSSRSESGDSGDSGGSSSGSSSSGSAASDGSPAKKAESAAGKETS